MPTASIRVPHTVIRSTPIWRYVRIYYACVVGKSSSRLAEFPGQSVYMAKHSYLAWARPASFHWELDKVRYPCKHFTEKPKIFHGRRVVRQNFLLGHPGNLPPYVLVMHEYCTYGMFVRNILHMSTHRSSSIS
jgi:hypothetical protein